MKDLKDLKNKMKPSVTDTVSPLQLMNKFFLRLHDCQKEKRTLSRTSANFSRFSCVTTNISLIPTANRSTVRVAPQFPDRRFPRLPDQHLEARRSFSPVQDRSLVSVFRSPATVHALTRPIPGSMLPDLILRVPASCFHSPFGFRLCYRFRFAPKSAASTPWPVAASSTGMADRFPCLHSPPGLLPPSGLKRSAGSAASQSAFRFRPISVRSPLPLSIASVSAADHRSRSATFPEARCSLRILMPPRNS
jgi:hypothetical protein